MEDILVESDVQIDSETAVMRRLKTDKPTSYLMYNTKQLKPLLGVDVFDADAPSNGY